VDGILVTTTGTMLASFIGGTIRSCGATSLDAVTEIVAHPSTVGIHGVAGAS
jgi:hypothetical protein